MPMTPRMLQLKQRIYESYAQFPDPASAEFARRVRDTATEAALRDIAALVVGRTPDAVDRLRDTVRSHREKLDLEAEEAQRQFALLRDSRETADRVYLLMENCLRLTLGLLRQHFLDVQLSPKTLQFAYSVPVPTDDQSKAERHSEAAQRALFDENVSTARNVFDAMQDETVKILLSIDTTAGGGVFRPPERRSLQPPNFSAIKYFTHMDAYEQARNASLGMNLTRNVHTGWFQGIVRRMERHSGISMTHLTGVAGYESFARRTRAALRRELAAIAAEQLRRIHSAVLAQAESYYAGLRLELIAQSSSHFTQWNRRIGSRLDRLGRERRKTNAYAFTAERLLVQADRAARQVLALRSHPDTEVHHNTYQEAPHNGLSTLAQRRLLS